jgi:hypothetical protein
MYPLVEGTYGEISPMVITSTDYMRLQKQQQSNHAATFECTRFVSVFSIPNQK